MDKQELAQMLAELWTEYKEYRSGFTCDVPEGIMCISCPKHAGVLVTDVGSFLEYLSRDKQK